MDSSEVDILIRTFAEAGVSFLLWLNSDSNGLFDDALHTFVHPKNPQTFYKTREKKETLSKYSFFK